MMRKIFTIVLSLLLLIVPQVVQSQEELTVYEGTTTNNYVPAYVYYFDGFTKSQFVIPAADLEEMTNSTITGVKFYTNSDNIPYTSVSDVVVYFMEVDYTSINAYEPRANGTLVYQGVLGFVSEGDGGSLTIEFSTPYTYTGGNLLVGIENITNNGWKNMKFFGTTVNGASIAGNSSSLDGVPATQRNFIPKTTFTYIPAGGVVCEKPATFVVNDVTAHTAVLTWNGSSSIYNVEYKKVGSADWSVYANGISDTTLTMVNLMHATDYQVRVQSVCADGVSGWKSVLFSTDLVNYDRVYVTENGTGDGGSWATATSDLNWALTTASMIKNVYGAAPDVWVAAGIYYGDTTAENAFTMVDGVNVYGGFAGNEPADYNLSLRDFEVNETILDGQNARRVLYQSSSFNVLTTWDGFTVRNGHTTGSVNGGGAYLNSRGQLSHCVITNNTAYNGGGVCAYYASLSNCVITHNNARNNGGGVCAYYSSTNVANCLISNNTANSYGGGVYNDQAIITNSTVVRNTSNYGSGIYGPSSGGILINSIVWGNGEDEPDNILGDISCSYSAIEGVCAGESNIVLNDVIHQTPQFVKPSLMSGTSDTTTTVDWHLQDGSVCINHGNNEAVMDSVDLDGTVRVKRDTVDLGCYESDYYSIPIVIPIVYVTENGAGTQTGDSWENAMASIQDAMVLAHTQSGMVWVAAGTYYGNATSSSAFTMINGVNVYGGFAGNEPADYDLSLRNFEANVTILDGQNARRVVEQPSSFNILTTWDGFTIQNGYVTGYNGGGACLRSKGKISHCVIKHNLAYNGGGVYAVLATISNCLISNNTASKYGGGVYASSSIITNSTIVRNMGSDGSGIWSSSSGGSLTNSIVWGNGADESINISGSITCSYSAVEGGFTGNHNILLSDSLQQTPLFVHPSLTSGVSDTTSDVNWHLQQGSVCINHGNNMSVTDSADLDGTSRIKRDTVDLGCYESDYYSVRPKIPIVYVTENGAGAKTGDSWANAMSSIQDAMALAQTRFGIVWVAAGIYYGETDSTSENAFTMVEGVDVYGGFAGNEPVDYDLSLRNFDVNATILDGQDTRRVLYQPANFSVETIWDGFTIQNGFVDGDGSGAYLQGNAMLRNSIVQNNTSYSYYKRGGGVYANGASQSSKVKIIRCIIRNNSTSSSYQGNGGGVYMTNANIEHSEIVFNSSSGNGGGIYAYSNVSINNCLIANNTSDSYNGSNYGGGIYSYNSTTILNTTIVRNLSKSNGAGLYGSGMSTTLANSIVWGNMKNEMLNNVGGSLSCSYSAIEGYCNGDNVIVLSEANPPLFVNPSSIAGISDTTNNVDWHLQEGSLCINRGDNNAVMSGLDLDDMLRIRQDTVDLGCYESNCFSTPYTEIEYSNVVYVTPSGAGRKTGENWANACSSISSAVSTSIIYGISQVWVAAGIYYGDTTAENAFTMVDGVNVYGGFAGNEPADYELSLRDFKTNETILDGQNARRVLNQPRAFNIETEWDGVTIQNGHANGYGGGAYLKAKGMLTRCVIKNNMAHCGGGIYAYGTNSVNKSIISHCQIMNNLSDETYYGNGGGVYISYSTIRNCLVANNTCNRYGKGGGVYSSYGEILNTTIVHNSGSSSYNEASSGLYSLGNTTMTNSIIWGNSIDVQSNGLSCSYSAIENGYAGDGNITLNIANPPLFIRPSFTTGVYDTTSNVDWRLREGSPCINKGDNSVVVDSLDLEGTLRVKRDTVDLGCFESDYYHSDGVGIQNVIYVTQTGSGNQSGNSWENAMSSIEKAQISAMNIGAVVWVAAGTYYGDTSSANAFTMHDGVCVYGGFGGNEPADYDLALRNFEINTTILDGADERRVLYQPSSFNATTIWDGFTVQNGHAIGSGTRGGGAYLSNNGKLCYCVVKNNIAYYGGGIYLGNNSTLSNCILSKNSANEGGGVYAGSNSNVSNCLISNNTGGGVYDDMATITNSTIVRNLRYSGAGIYCPSEGNVVNSIVWGNGSNETDNIYGNVSCSYSAVEGGYEGNNNILLNSNNPPLFVNPSAIAGAEDSTSNVDWHLQLGSPCINRGDNTAVTDSLDVDAIVRVKRDTVDLGCYESDFYNDTESNNYGSVVYVTPTGAGNYSGDSWANATSSIEEAQAIALTHGAVVWVAAGTYYGDTIGYNAFTMREGVNVYGGFAGDEPDTFDLSQRDLENNTSILDGMNTHRVLYQPNYFNDLTTWDGFTIQNGTGRCDLKKNGAISRCKITHNQGGGVYSDGSIITNCLIANNGGSGICSRGNTQIINSTVVRNGGGGLTSDSYSYGENLMKNCIVWGNEPYNILLDNDEINCTYSAIGYGFPGDHNIPLVEGDSVFQPFFVNPSVVAGINDSTENVDWRLSQNSICINKGDNLVVIDSFDIAGNIRVQNDTVDIGCYESNYYGVTTKSANYGNIVYVTLQGSGTEMGDSWENATSSFLFALSMAKTKEASVWVAAGIYYGDTIASSESAFTMQEGVNVYGGFAGNEPADYDLSSRDFVSNETILDGDSARRVLFQPYQFNLETTWDGFTIRNGVANAHDVHHWDDNNNGGGAYLRRAGMLNNCVIKNNQSNRYGGGIYALDKFVIRNCQLLYNAAWTGGGGLCVYGNYDTIEISNCLIANNAHGGIHMTTYKSSSINNSTIVRNSQAVNADSQTAYLKNCIVWGNASNFSGSINCSYSAIEGGYEGDSNITLNAEHLPLFVNPSQTAGADDPSASVDWHLLLGSPCINAGDNTEVIDSVDLDGTARIKRGTVDLGCYESDYGNESYLGVVYVTVTGAGMQTGDSWANAISSVETAQNIASNVGAVVWVASGTYYGDTTANNAFTMHDGVSVFGGFVGNEPASYDLSLRDFETNATILDGQNLRRVLYQPNNFNDTTKWEGFTIQNGRTSGYEKGAGAYLQRRGQLSHCRIQGNISMNSHGGGIYCENTSVNNCDIIGNTCCAGGGGVYALNSEVSGCIIEDNLTTCKYYNGGGGVCSSSSTIFECQIRGNTSAYYGGGVYSVDNSTVRDCHIVDNTSDYGGGVYASSGIIVSCQISHNKSSFTGGGITSTSLSTQIRNCLVDNNTAGKTSSHYGGGIYGSSTVMNSTIVRNRSAGDGAGVFGNSSIILQNCIIWGNMRNGSTNSLSGSSVTCSYSAVEGGCDGDNVITLTAGNPPLFANPSLTAGADDSTANVDWHLQNGSVCVNRGDNIFVTDSLDLDGATRIKRDIVDLGCYESDYNSAGDLLSHVYVTAGGAGAQTGDSWENAVATIGEALQLAQANNSDVWVAAGTYYGDTTAANAFTMVEGVNVYGGFVGDEPADYDLSLRNFEANATILDGQDVRRVLYQPATFNVFTIWDGFTIQNGHTTGIGNGGGAYLRNRGKISNCVIKHNSAHYGGGVYASSAIISHCLISGNTAVYGGGVSTNNSTTNVTNCLISNNTASNSGGGVYNNGANITSSTIVRNIANNGTGVYGYSGGNLTNSIVWGNGEDMTKNISGSVTCSFSAVEGGFSGNQNIMLSDYILQTPRFVCPSFSSGASDTTSNVDWHLQQGSVCINRGNNSETTTSLDLDGTARIKRDTVDMGCYESDYYSVPITEYDSIIYVTVTGAGTHSGNSWANATSSIDTAQALAQLHNAVVWVAAGIYYGDTTSANAFTMHNGVSVYGGFAGNEPADYNLSLRDFEMNATVLEGQNVRRVLYQPSAFGEEAVWDGFTITHGQITGNGAGAYLQDNGKLSHCVVENNAGRGGGGIYCKNTTVSSCVVRNNSSTGSGDAVSNGGGIYASNSVIDSCQVSHNTQSNNHWNNVGGGVCITASSVLRNSIVSYNSSTGDAGGVYILFSGSIYNCQITNNTSSVYGGGVYANAQNSSNVISNSLIANNTSSNSGGGICMWYSNASVHVINSTIVNNAGGAGIYSSNSTAYLRNCLVWGNGSSLSGSVNCMYSAIQGGYSGEGNVNLSSQNTGDGTHPFFVNPTQGRGTSYSGGDWHLLEQSACINAGSLDSTLLTETDLDGNPRVHQERVDMGCYEWQYDVIDSVVSIIVIPNDAALGTVTGSGTYTIGDTVTLHAIPNQHVRFLRWSDNDTTNPRVVIVETDTTFTAIFEYYLPELHIDTITHSDFIGGEPVTISWTVQNDGTAPTPNGEVWYDRVWLSVESRVAAGDNNPILLGVFPNVSALAPGEYYTQTQSFDIPLSIAGSYYLFVITDANDATVIYWDSEVQNPYNPPPYIRAYSHHCSGAECGNYAGNRILEITEVDDYPYYHDNFFYELVNIAIPPLPDLKIPALSSNIQNFYSGSQVNLTFQILNDGNYDTRVQQWKDVVFISYHSEFDETARVLKTISHQGLLLPDSSYQVSTTVTVPLEMHGTAYFYAYTDYYDQVYEHVGRYNNVTRSDSVNVILTPPADLIPRNITADNTVSTGASFHFSYEIHNQGAGAPNYSTWLDRCYLSTSADSLVDAIQVANDWHYSGLPVGDSYTVSHTVALPTSITEGTYYLFIQADANNNVFEFTFENNNLLRYAQPITVLQPDLQITTLNVQDTLYAGAEEAISYRIANTGNGAVINQTVKDWVYLSQSFNGSSATQIAELSHNCWLNAQDSLLKMQNVTLPSNLQEGVYYLFVRTNATNTLHEADIDNNRSPIKQVYIHYQPLPDLIVTNVTLPEVIVAGDTVMLGVHLKNNGEIAANISNLTWKMVDTIGNQEVKCTIRPDNAGVASLAAGDSIYLVKHAFIPPAVSGNPVSLTLVVNPNHALTESNYSNNKYTIIHVVQPYPFDLSVNQLNAPAGVVSGEYINVTWRVKNEGSVPVSSHSGSGSGSRETVDQSVQWYDKVYLSQDSIFDNTDVEIGYYDRRTVVYAGRQYNVNKSFQIPVYADGNYYILVVSDADSATFDCQRTNNVRGKPITVTQSALPDLQMDTLLSPNTLTTGASYQIPFTVSNEGDHITHGDRWTDALYLNDEPTTEGAELLGSRIHNAQLDVNGQYIDSIGVTIPNTWIGDGYLIGYTDATDQIFEKNSDSNNLFIMPVSVARPLPCDLTVLPPDFPQNANVGENVQISWTLQNVGLNVAQGDIKDAVYLSIDSTWSSDDIMLGSLQYDVNLAANSQEQRNDTFLLQGVPAGDYYVVVRTNILNALNENSYINNKAVSLMTMHVDYPSLYIDQEEQVQLNSGQSVYYKLEVGPEYEHQTLSCKLTAPTPNVSNGLYIAYSSAPSASNFDWSATMPYVQEQEILIPSLNQGTYYIMATGQMANNAVQPVTLLATIVDFEIISVTANSGANTGSVTTQIIGAKFDTVMDFRLANSNGYLPAEKVFFHNSTESYATFNLRDQETGVYDMVAELPGGIITVKGQAFVVEQGLPAELLSNIIAPASVRNGNTFTVTIEYGNNGSTDLNISGFLLVSTNGFPIAFSSDSLANNATELTFETGEPNGNPDVIRPGYFATKTVFVKANRVGNINLKLYPIRRQY